MDTRALIRVFLSALIGNIAAPYIPLYLPLPFGLGTGVIVGIIALIIYLVLEKLRI